MGHRYLKIIRDQLHLISRFFIPPLCVVCENEIERGLLCGHCYDQIMMVPLPICPTCGHPLGNHKDCKICKSLNPAFDHIRAWALFVPPLDRIIHSFKYERKPSLAHLLGRSMARVAESDPLLKEAQYLIPVPLYKGRQRERGYNQAELLSRVIKEEIKKEVLNCLIRTRNTPTQTRLTEFERKQNVLGAFSLSGGISIQGRSVILIDDVMTTGATLNECARVLKEAGADRVYGLICAVAPV